MATDDFSDLDDDLDFGEDFDSMVDGDSSGNRDVSNSSLKDAGAGFIDDFKDDKLDTVKEITQNAFNTVAGSEVSGKVNKLTSSFKKEYSTATKEVKKVAAPVIASLKRVVPEDSMFSGVINKIDSAIGGKRFSSDSKSAEELQAEQIQSNIDGAIGLKKDTEFKKKMIDDLIVHNMEKKREEKLASISAFSKATYDFHSNETSSFYRKTLELQYKHLFIAKDSKDIMKLGFDAVTKLTESVVKNTGLPDFIKLRSSEALKAKVRSNLQDNLMGNLFKSNGWVDNTIKNVKGKVTSATNTLVGGLGATGSALDQYESANDPEMAEMGMSKANMVGGLAGSFAKEAIGGIFGKILGKSKFGKGMQDTMNKISIDPSGFFKEAADGTDNSMLNKVFGFMSDITSDSESGKDVKIDKEDLDLNTVFDVRTKDSIVKVIPGLLSKIHSEVKSLRTGKKEEELGYNFQKGIFENKGDFKKGFMRDIRKSVVTSGMTSDMIDLSKTILGKLYSKLSKEELKIFTEYVYDYSIHNTNPNAFKLSNPKFYQGLRTVNPRLESKIFRLLKKVQGTGTENAKNANIISKKLVDIRSKANDPSVKIKQLLDSGKEEELIQLGVIKWDNDIGGYNVDIKKYQEMESSALSSTMDKDFISRVGTKKNKEKASQIDVKMAKAIKKQRDKVSGYTEDKLVVVGKELSRLKKMTFKEIFEEAKHSKLAASIYANLQSGKKHVGKAKSTITKSTYYKKMLKESHKHLDPIVKKVKKNKKLNDLYIAIKNDEKFKRVNNEINVLLAMASELSENELETRLSAIYNMSPDEIEGLARDTAEAAYDGAKDIYDNRDEHIETAKKKVNEKVNTAKKTAEDIYDNRDEHIETVKKKVNEKVNTAKKTAEDIYDNRDEHIETAKKKVNEKVNTAKKTAKDIYDNRDEHIETAKKKVNEKVNTAKKVAEELTSDIKKKADEVYETIEDEVEKELFNRDIKNYGYSTAIINLSKREEKKRHKGSKKQKKNTGKTFKKKDKDLKDIGNIESPADKKQIQLLDDIKDAIVTGNENDKKKTKDSKKRSGSWMDRLNLFNKKDADEEADTLGKEDSKSKKKGLLGWVLAAAGGMLGLAGKAVFGLFKAPFQIASIMKDIAKYTLPNNPLFKILGGLGSLIKGAFKGGWGLLKIMTGLPGLITGTAELMKNVASGIGNIISTSIASSSGAGFFGGAKNILKNMWKSKKGKLAIVAALGTGGYAIYNKYFSDGEDENSELPVDENGELYRSDSDIDINDSLESSASDSSSMSGNFATDTAMMIGGGYAFDKAIDGTKYAYNKTKNFITGNKNKAISKVNEVTGKTTTKIEKGFFSKAYDSTKSIVKKGYRYVKNAVLWGFNKVKNGGKWLAKNVKDYKSIIKLLKTAKENVVEGAAKIIGHGKGLSILSKTGKLLSKFKVIPIAGLIIGTGLAIYKLTQGDLTGALLEATAGAVSMMPGVGTAAALAIQVGIEAREYYLEKDESVINDYESKVVVREDKTNDTDVFLKQNKSLKNLTKLRDEAMNNGDDRKVKIYSNAIHSVKNEMGKFKYTSGPSPVNNALHSSVANSVETKIANSKAGYKDPTKLKVKDGKVDIDIPEQSNAKEIKNINDGGRLSGSLKTIAYIIRVAETNNIYNKVAILKDDAGISFGAYQFTEHSGSLYKVLKETLSLNPPFADDLKIILGNFKGSKKNKYGANKRKLKAFLKETGASNHFRIAQDKTFVKEYYSKGLALARKHKFKSPGVIVHIIDMFHNTPRGAKHMVKYMNNDDLGQAVAARLAYYKTTKNGRKYYKGLTNRVNKVTKLIEKYLGEKFIPGDVDTSGEIKDDGTRSSSHEFGGSDESNSESSGNFLIDGLKDAISGAMKFFGGLGGSITVSPSSSPSLMPRRVGNEFGGSSVSYGGTERSGGKGLPDPQGKSLDVFVKTLLSTVGHPYVWGGTSLTKGADCSGLVYAALNRAGFKIGRTNAVGYWNSKRGEIVKTIKDLKIGDSVFFRNRKGELHHIATVTGFAPEGTPIITHAKCHKCGTLTEKMNKNYHKEFVGGKRWFTSSDNVQKVLGENNPLADAGMEHNDDVSVDNNVSGQVANGANNGPVVQRNDELATTIPKSFGNMYSDTDTSTGDLPPVRKPTSIVENVQQREPSVQSTSMMTERNNNVDGFGQETIQKLESIDNTLMKSLEVQKMSLEAIKGGLLKSGQDDSLKKGDTPSREAINNVNKKKPISVKRSAYEPKKTND